MSSALQLIKRSEWTECLVCSKPLGVDSKDNGFMFCHEHRACSICNENVNAQDAKWSLQRFLEDESETPITELKYDSIEIMHSRCYSRKQLASTDPIISIKQSELDRLNLIRLSVEPDVNLSQNQNEKNADIYSRRLVAEMNFEQLSLHLSMLQACLANVQSAIRMNPERRRTFLQEREAERFSEAKKQALTSSRPITKSAEAPDELQLAAFVELRGLNPALRTENLKSLKLRNKTVKKLMEQLKMSEQEAIEYCEKFKQSGS